MSSAWAQADLSTQEFQRQQERERELRRQQERGADVRLPPQPAAPTTQIPERETPCYPIRRIALQGDEAGRFEGLLEGLLEGLPEGGDAGAAGRCLGVQGINAVMSRLQNAIVARGYVTTRVLAEPQDLNSGVLTLTILAGRVRQIRFAADADPRGTQWNALPVQPGQLLNLRDIEQGLENFKRVPTAEADIKIEPAQGEGALPGQSDLVISYRQAFPLRLAVSLDDSGSDATGKYQGSITVSFDNWWTLNDLFYASFNHDLGGGQPGTRGVSGYTVHYSVPLGYWSLGFTTSSSDYHQTVAGLTQSYLYRGKSDTSELKLSRLVYRDASRKTSLSAKAFLRSSSNYVDDTEIEVQRRRTAGWELGMSHREFIGDGTLDLNLAYRRGTGAFSSLPAPEESFGEGTSRFSLATLDLSLNQPFSVDAPWGRQALRYLMTARAQWNGSPLTPQGHQTTGSSGWLSKKTVTTRYLVDQSQEAGSTVSGNTVSVNAGKDVNITGSNVVSTAGTSINAGNDVNISSASDKADNTSLRNEVTSGLFSGGGFGVTIGKQQMDNKNRTVSSTAVSSMPLPRNVQMQ